MLCTSPNIPSSLVIHVCLSKLKNAVVIVKFYRVATILSTLILCVLLHTPLLSQRECRYICKLRSPQMSLCHSLSPSSHLPVCTAVQTELLDDLLNSLFPLLPGHVGWKTERSREVEILPHRQGSRHYIILQRKSKGTIKAETTYWCM